MLIDWFISAFLTCLFLTLQVDAEGSKLQEKLDYFCQEYLPTRDEGCEERPYARLDGDQWRCFKGVKSDQSSLACVDNSGGLVRCSKPDLAGKQYCTKDSNLRGMIDSAATSSLQVILDNYCLNQVSVSRKDCKKVQFARLDGKTWRCFEYVDTEASLKYACADDRGLDVKCMPGYTKEWKGSYRYCSMDEDIRNLKGKLVLKECRKEETPVEEIEGPSLQDNLDEYCEKENCNGNIFARYGLDKEEATAEWRCYQSLDMTKKSESCIADRPHTARDLKYCGGEPVSEKGNYCNKDKEITSIINQELVQSPCEYNICVSQEGCPLKKGTLLTTLPYLNPDFFISFEFKITDYQSGYQNLLHFTNNGNNDGWGSRIPGVWIKDSGQLYVCFSISGNGNKCQPKETKQYQKDKWHSVQIYQRLKECKVPFTVVFTVVVDGLIVMEEDNVIPDTFNNVKVYGADSWHNPMKGSIRNLIINKDTSKICTELDPGIASMSSEYSDKYSAAKCIDGDLDTYCYNQKGGDENPFFMIEYKEPKKVYQVRLIIKPGKEEYAKGIQVFVSVDCQNSIGKGKDYTGSVSKTKSGKTCKNWSSTTKSSIGDHNQCRNPDGEDGVWCYTTDPNTKWELCDVPFCTEDSSGTQIGSTFEGPPTEGQVIDFISETGVEGKNVIVKQGKGTITFAEVQVNPDAVFENGEKGKTGSNSSTENDVPILEGTPNDSGPAIVYKYTSSYDLIWKDQGPDNEYGSIWRPKNYQSEYCLIGDVAITGSDIPQQMALVIAAKKTGVLVHPTSFTKIWTNQANNAIYQMNAPAGYTCLGGVGWRSNTLLPEKKRFCCVKDEYLVEGENELQFQRTGVKQRLSLYTVIRGEDQYGMEGFNFNPVLGFGEPSTGYLLKGDEENVKNVWDLNEGETVQKPLKLYEISDLKQIWNSTGGLSNSELAIWRSESKDQYSSIGDVAIDNLRKPSIGYLVKVSDPQNYNALKPPVSYSKVWDNKGSGSSQPLTIWRVTCKPGFIALGNVATAGKRPKLGEIMCVNLKYTEKGSNNGDSWKLIYQDAAAKKDVSIFEALESKPTQQATRTFQAVPNYHEFPGSAYLLAQSAIDYSAEKPIVQVFMNNVQYLLDEEEKLPAKPVSLKKTSIENYSSISQKVTKTISYAKSSSSSFSSSMGLEVGVQMTATYGVPAVSSVAAQVSTKVSMSMTTGKTKTTTETDSTAVSVTVPACSKMYATVSGNEYTSNIPYEATIRKIYYDGDEATGKISGIYTGVGVSEVSVKYGKTIPLPPSTCSAQPQSAPQQSSPKMTQAAPGNVGIMMSSSNNDIIDKYYEQKIEQTKNTTELLTKLLTKQLYEEDIKIAIYKHKAEDLGVDLPDVEEN